MTSGQIPVACDALGTEREALLRSTTVRSNESRRRRGAIGRNSSTVENSKTSRVTRAIGDLGFYLEPKPY